MDKAGEVFWNQHWSNVADVSFKPHDPRTRHHGDRALADLIRRSLDRLPPDSLVLEAGCADSSILPYVGHKLGFRIAGFDYSENGCERFRQRLRVAGLDAAVECCDMFSPPASMLGKHDAALSFGLVEHFTDTAGAVRALARFVRPGGRILTLVPNMQGAVGLVQWLAGPAVYKVHEALSPRALAEAHAAAGLKVVEADYLLPMGFGVVNFNQPAARLLVLTRRLMVAALARLSWLTWLAEEKGLRVPRTSTFSPYAYCIAQTQTAV